MPFKTRKQKETATQRRFTLGNNVLVSYRGGGEKKEIDAKIESLSSSGKSKDQVENKIVETVYIHGDLLKILFAASILVVAQITLGLTLA